MNTAPKNNNNRTSEWQSAKMKSLIEERWLEVWQIVVSRERDERSTCSNIREVNSIATII